MTQSIDVPIPDPELVRWLISTRRASGWILVRTERFDHGGTRLSFRWRAPSCRT
jgi:hypothetical protein